ncbi:NAD-dependent deacylase [Halopelagius longus]|uniref:NAD-dependent deacetylase n=1 Tax=Halopelagius longus TaxID=1236180 RepID=A0A1H0Y315_9EURY|nr:NAD-dependent deacylase [Halopelagius longus]RDI72248.1 NAD-dependent deacylase [Halopelagius longus]SDQ09500.1 NAD-dependent deacetylase [Halopelagius longus]
MDDELASVADALATAESATAMTGAGVSTASGIPSFRGEDGIWNTDFDPDDFSSDRFRDDPDGFWRDRLDLHERMFAADPEPNPAHDALVRLEEMGVVDAVVTQNTDGLHEEAGSGRLIELHGNASRAACVECDATVPAEEAFEAVRGGETPRCPACEGLMKPDVVLFGEELPYHPFDAARRMAREGDLFLAVGSSLTVDPAASLPEEASRFGGELAVVNLEETEKDRVAHHVVREDATEALPALVEMVEARLAAKQSV